MSYTIRVNPATRNPNARRLLHSPPLPVPLLPDAPPPVPGAPTPVAGTPPPVRGEPVESVRGEPLAPVRSEPGRRLRRAESNHEPAPPRTLHPRPAGPAPHPRRPGANRHPVAPPCAPRPAPKPPAAPQEFFRKNSYPREVADSRPHRPRPRAHCSSPCPCRFQRPSRRGMPCASGRGVPCGCPPAGRWRRPHTLRRTRIRGPMDGAAGEEFFRKNSYPREAPDSRPHRPRPRARRRGPCPCRFQRPSRRGMPCASGRGVPCGRPPAGRWRRPHTLRRTRIRGPMDGAAGEEFFRKNSYSREGRVSRRVRRPLGPGLDQCCAS